MNRVIIIGGGAAGCMAAYMAAGYGAQAVLLESTPRLMNKVRITGKGRCNLTNACGTEAFLAHIIHNPRFFRSAFARYDNQWLMELFETLGVPLKVERGQRVFPQSDRAHDVADALVAALAERGVEVLYKTRAKSLVEKQGRIAAVQCEHGRTISGDAFILASGGLSYPLTGSTGDGYALARQVGHTVTPLQPSLAPIQVEQAWVQKVAGLSLKNVCLRAIAAGKQVFCEQGEMLFTHTGVSGPLALSASAHLEKQAWPQTKLFIDWKPALDEGQLKQRLIREMQFAPNRETKTMMLQLVPMSMAEVMLSLAGIPAHLPCHDITKQKRAMLMAQLKRMELTVRDVGPMEGAIVTKGGIQTKEIDPKTMRSKRIQNLYVAGEVLDLDAYTGGYNLQIAFSTGAAAGTAAAQSANQ